MLTERPNIIPAPYLARAQWVALESRDALGAQELATLLRESYDLVVAKLPKRSREGLSVASPVKEKLLKPRGGERFHGGKARKKTSGKRKSRRNCASGF